MILCSCVRFSSIPAILQVFLARNCMFFPRTSGQISSRYKHPRLFHSVALGAVWASWSSRRLTHAITSRGRETSNVQNPRTGHRWYSLKIHIAAFAILLAKCTEWNASESPVYPAGLPLGYTSARRSACKWNRDTTILVITTAFAGWFLKKGFILTLCIYINIFYLYIYITYTWRFIF